MKYSIDIKSYIYAILNKSKNTRVKYFLDLSDCQNLITSQDYYEGVLEGGKSMILAIVQHDKNADGEILLNEDWAVEEF